MKISNNGAVESVSTAVEKVPSLLSPANCIIKSCSSPPSVKPNESFRIRALLINTGAADAHDVVAKLRPSVSLELSSDSTITVGMLTSGQEKELEWTLQAELGVSALGTWTIGIESSDAMVSSYIGVLSIESETTPPTGGAIENTYAYPNPFNPEVKPATLRFSVSKSAKVTVKLYDAGGRLVTTLADDQYMETGEEQSLSWDGMNDKGDIVANGVYFCVITTDQGERAVGKVAVLR